MKQKPVIFWLKSGIVMIMIMIMIGGITRLTGSGLSITEWRVVGGTIPPITEAEWKDAFEKYQQTPEFKIKNFDMKLEGFKSIFFWEYLHRLWGRIMGFVFFIPYLYFWKKGYFKENGLAIKMFMVLILGGLQGALGWFMVASGLVDQPHVSHFRLTAHLLMALLLITYLLWLIYEVKIAGNDCEKKPLHPLNFLVKNLLGIILIQLIYGGFMSGKKAAYFYPTYPDMGGKMIPDNLWIEGGISNLTENVTMIHFIHRLLPWIIVTMFIYLIVKLKKLPADLLRLKSNLILIGGLITLQIILGIKTVVLDEGQISVFWGTAHQVVGVTFFLAVWWLWLSLTRVSGSKWL